MMNKEYLELLCYSYIRAVNGGIATDQLRRKIHQKLLDFTTLPEHRLKKILHNLDKYIGLNQLRHWTVMDEIIFGKKLCNVILKEMVEHIKSDGDAKEFLESKGFDTVEDWLEYWKLSKFEVGKNES